MVLLPHCIMQTEVVIDLNLRTLFELEALLCTLCH